MECSVMRWGIKACPFHITTRFKFKFGIRPRWHALSECKKSDFQLLLFLILQIGSSKLDWVAESKIESNPYFLKCRNREVTVHYSCQQALTRRVSRIIRTVYPKFYRMLTVSQYAPCASSFVYSKHVRISPSMEFEMVSRWINTSLKIVIKSKCALPFYFLLSWNIFGVGS